MRILLVEDDEMLGGSLARGLSQSGHRTDWIRNGADALNALQGHDAAILDMNLPHYSGIDIVHYWRNNGHMQLPVLMLTAMDAVEYRVRGLDAGADDYLTKPFDYEELLARLRSLTRRMHARSDAILRCGEFTLNPKAHTLHKGNELIPLTGKELRVCSLLLERRNQIVSKSDIEQLLYSSDDDVDSNTVEVTIYNLRRKLSKDFVQTLRGVGYMVRA